MLKDLPHLLQFALIYLCGNDRTIRGKLYTCPNWWPQGFSQLILDMAVNVDHPRQDWIAPRQFFKTSFFATEILWRICFRKSDRLTVITASGGPGSLAERYLTRFIRPAFVKGTLLHRDFGNLIGDVDRMDEIHFSNGCYFRAKGKGFAYRGDHPNWGGFDDVETSEEARSEDQREKMWDYFSGDVLASLDEPGDDSIFKAIGNNFHPLCFVGRIYNDEEGRFNHWLKKKYSATNADGTALWPEAWPLEKLALMRKEIGNDKYLAEFENQPIVPGVVILRREWFRHYDFDIATSDFLSQMKLVLSFDSALSRKENSDFRAATIWGRGNYGPHKNNRYLIDAQRERWSLPDQVNFIFSSQERFGYRLKLVIENAKEGIALQQMLEEEARKRGIFLDIEMVQPVGDKSSRMQLTTPDFQNGLVYFPEKNGLPVFTAFEDELVTFPTGKRDDFADCTSMALNYFRSIPDAGMAGQPTSFLGRRGFRGFSLAKR